MTLTPLADLDEAVRLAARHLNGRGVERVDALYALATGVGSLPAGLESAGSVVMGEIPGVPPTWSHCKLHVGRRRGAQLLLLEDASGEPGGAEERRPRWERGFPYWLAAALGAPFCIHVGAGVALPVDDAQPLAGKSAFGGLALLSDHINFSGQTPLLGLADSQLGPLFPDLSELHHAGLRASALDHAKRRGIPAVEAVAACTLGPALLTPAERRFFARAGAQVAAQGLADPLLASAHAGLNVLAVLAVTEDGAGELDVRAVVEATQALAPAIDELLALLTEDVSRMAEELRECE